MCTRVICTKCKKYTWSGCGKHIEEALKGVPPDQRCQCIRKKKKDENKYLYIS